MRSPARNEANSAPQEQQRRCVTAHSAKESQTAVCNRHHSLDQQLCRWLLLSLDRLQGNELGDEPFACQRAARSEMLARIAAAATGTT